MGGRPDGSARSFDKLLVAVVAIVASAIGITNEFAHDDLHLIVGNERVHSLGALGEQFTSPFWPAPFAQDLYRPLATLLLSLQYAIGGEDPLLFRLVSYAAYAGCAVMTYVVARRVVGRPAALLAGTVFAAHPVHVEAVALSAAQNELLVGLIAATVTLRYLRARQSGQLAWREWAILCALAFAACLLKETGLVLPALILVTELVLGPAETRSWSRLGTGVAAMGATVAIYFSVRAAVLGDVIGTFTAEALIGLDAAGRALTMLSVVPQWVRLLVWPAHLRLDYSPQEFTASTGFGGPELLGVLLLVGAVAVAIGARREAPLVTFGVAWCTIALIPVSNVVVPTGVLLAERTLFLPSMGFAFALAGAIEWLAPRLRARAADRVLMVAGAALVSLGVVRSMERHRVWRNDGFLSVRTVQDAPRSFRAQRAYADVLFAIQRSESALEAYERAIDLAPDGLEWRVRNDLARQLRDRGDHRAEADQLEASLRQQPRQLDARGYLIGAYLATGEYGRAALQADSSIGMGGSPQVFSGLRRLADSARRVDAPAGSIRIGINAGAVTPRER